MTESSTSSPFGFADRHFGVRATDQAKMLAEVGYPSLDALIDAAVPASIRTPAALALPAAASEAETSAELADFAARNVVSVPMIGLGYYPTRTPTVIRRNILESPSWYTAYTPYQPEISQGRLEALINFQTMVGDLTGLPTANASLLDEATAVVEAVMVMRRATSVASTRILVDGDTLPQTLHVVTTRAEAVGIEVELIDVDRPLPGGDFFGLVLSYPTCSGEIHDLTQVINEAHDRGALVAVATDLLALTLIRTPGELGADIAVGSAQRFGVPLFYGGPHPGFICIRDGLERHLPGRLVGVSIDTAGRPAYRLALQTREQHIRRDRATSNICTAQVLLAVVASMYAVYHGPEGLKTIARRVHGHMTSIAQALRTSGFEILTKHYFDTVVVHVPSGADAILQRAAQRGLRLRAVDHAQVGISCSEITTSEHVSLVLECFEDETRTQVTIEPEVGIPLNLQRRIDFLRHPVFNSYHSETSMLRYMRRLRDKDFALDRGMIPLGSCTMKLNATTEMEPIVYPGFADIHPFAPASDVTGYFDLIGQLEDWLAEVTGYAKVSIQPNAGSQGELAGLLAIRAYHKARGEQRATCLIPASAHGTNAASAVLAGMRVVVVGTNDDGTIDMGDLEQKCIDHSSDLAAMMITYPSTHGVYESTITTVCSLVHRHGGQVYVDGANLNALLGVAKPGEFGGDVSHLNLHKTFCIPHGGGGPGVGPVAVAEHLIPFLPGHPLHPDPHRAVAGIGAVSAAPFGSAGILPISWAYIRMMGGEGLTSATKLAVLSANYLAQRLSPHFPILYTGQDGLVAHECILDLRPLTAATGVTVDDIAKRLVDFGFHAPTVSFPVAGTLMLEPTESEDLAELDRFINAMIAIRGEIDKVAAGTWSIDESPLRLAPHTAETLVRVWDRPYSRELGAFPSGFTPDKYWPPTARIEQAYGDRNLVCTCPEPSAFEDRGAS